jgi:hypothetical protein
MLLETVAQAEAEDSILAVAVVEPLQLVETLQV